MYKLLQKLYDQAKKDGRICSQCGWIVTQYRYKKGLHTCWNCEDANKGVNVSSGYNPPADEFLDMTGEA